MRSYKSLGLIYFFVVLSKLSMKRKKLDPLLRKIREGRGHGHDRDSSRKYFCKQFIHLKACVLANSKRLVKFGSWWHLGAKERFMTWTLRLLTGHIISLGTAWFGKPSLGFLCSHERKRLTFYYHAIAAKLGCWGATGRRGAAPGSCPRAQAPC